MRKHLCIHLLSATLVILTLPRTLHAEPKMETWTSRAGTRIEAAVVEISDDGMVTLRSPEGEIFKIAASALDAVGQERIRAMAKKQRDARLAEARDAVRQLRAIVPDAYLRDGDNVLGRFESRTITGIVYEPSGHMDLFIKENGQYQSPPVRFSFSVQYVMPDPRRPSHMIGRTRPRVEWIAPPEFSNNRARFRMRMEHGVEAELVYVFRADGVDTSYQVIDPEDIQYPSSRSHMTLRFPAIFHEDRSVNPPRFFSPRVPEGTDRASFFASTEEFEVRSGSGGRAAGRRTPFNQSTRSIGGGNWIEIGGGVYGPHTLRIERPRRGGSLRSYIYPDNIPAQGWLVYFRRAGHSNAIQSTDMMSATVQ